MEGPLPNSYLPLFTKARVDAHDITHHSVWCSVPSGQQLGTPVKVLTRGNNDLYRINQDPLPVVGTWGLIALVGGDSRAAFWIGAYDPSENTAVLTSGTQGAGESTGPNSIPSATDAEYEYNAYWSGTYTVLDPFGNYFAKFVDGSYILIGVTDTPPKMYVYQVDGSGAQVLVPITDASRIPNVTAAAGTLPPPNPFYIDVNQLPTGARFLVDPSGNITLFSKTDPISGGGTSHSTIHVAADGTITISSLPNFIGDGDLVNPSTINVAPDGTITINAVASTDTNPYKIEVDPSGAISLFGPNFSKINLSPDGDILLIANTNTNQAVIDIQENGQIEISTIDGNNITLDNAGGISIHAPTEVTISSSSYIYLNTPTVYIPGTVVHGSP